MVKVTVKDKTYYLDGYLKNNYDSLKTSVKKKFDGVILVDGIEGTGKSMFAFAGAHYLSNGNFDLCDVFFTIEQFIDWVDNAPKYRAGVWDEFALSGLSLDALTLMQKVLLKKMIVMRKKQLYLFLVAPSYFMLSDYFACHRSRALIHVYSPDMIERGYFRFFNYTQKKHMYYHNRKGKSHTGKHALYSFVGRFTDYENIFFSADAYDEKKEKALQSINTETKSDRWKKVFIDTIKGARQFLLDLDYKKKESDEIIGGWAGRKPSTIRQWACLPDSKGPN